MTVTKSEVAAGQKERLETELKKIGIKSDADLRDALT